ncbi:MAG: hypothetical protein AAFW87_14565 [Pseudomonadota bacterium]
MHEAEWKTLVRFAIPLLILLSLPFHPAAASDPLLLPAPADLLKLVKRGWVYEIHTSRVRRPPDLPEVEFNSPEVALGPVCVIGDAPHPQTRTVIDRFVELLAEIYGRQVPVSYQGGNIGDCKGLHRTYIRLYSGRPPYGRFNADIRELDKAFDIRFPKNWREPILSPAQTNGFFGRNGATAHLLISQPSVAAPTKLQLAFHSSILIEELFQAVTFGADILKFERGTPFYSKLQEFPSNLRYLSWQSDAFMTGILRSNPNGLCGFDVLMLHTLAGANLRNSNTPELLTYLKAELDALLAKTEATMDDDRFAGMLDKGCRTWPD